MIRDRKDTTYHNLLDNFKIGLTLSAAYLLSFVGILALPFFINELTHRIRLERRRTARIGEKIKSAFGNFGVTRLSAMGLFALFVHLFLWLTQLLLTNNIKTNKVVSLQIFRCKQREN